MTVKELREELSKYSDDLVVMMGDECIIPSELSVDTFIVDPRVPKDQLEYREYLWIN